MDFYEGLEVIYDDHYGTINFVGDAYITLKVVSGKHKSKDVLLLVYKTDWGKIKLRKESEK